MSDTRATCNECDGDRISTVVDFFPNTGKTTEPGDQYYCHDCGMTTTVTEFPRRISDSHALAIIRKCLSDDEWDASTCDDVALAVIASGRPVTNK